MSRHVRVVAEIAANVRSFYERKEPFRISHGSTNSTRLSTRQRNRIVDTSALRHVINVDKEKKTALVEPNVPMDKLVDVTLKYGLVPPVVMEFPGITVGGGYAGTSGESSSFKHGFFDRTINKVEMVLANGDIVTASGTERADLFHGAAGAVGSMGITTLVELRLEEAKSHVETTYHPVSSIAEAVTKIRDLTSDTSLDYVDGILFSPTSGVLVTGRLTNNPSPSYPRPRFTRPHDQWFYLHAEALTRRSPKAPSIESIPLYDYLFRYDRGGFWVGSSAFTYMLSFPFNRFTRWFLDDFLRTRMLYKALHASGYSKQYVVQDLALPYETAGQFISYTEEKFGIWPLWLCPLKQSPAPTMHPHTTDNTTASSSDPATQPPPMLNIGLWGFPSQTSTSLFPFPSDFATLNRQLESKLKSLGGMKWLYAQTYYTTATEFWQSFDKEWYDRLRRKYFAEGLPSVWDKVKGPEADAASTVAGGKRKKSVGTRILETRPWGGLYGIWKAVLSMEWRGRVAKRGRFRGVESTEDEGFVWGEGHGGVEVKKER